jgi:thiol:disulfide interchange protein DsbD
MRPSTRLGVLFAALAVALSAVRAEPIRLEVDLIQPARPGGTVVVEFRFLLEPGVHVYAAESHFFRLEDRRSEGLGAPSLALPETIEVPDLLSEEPGAVVRVFKGDARIRVTRPVTGRAGGRWHWDGALHYQGCTDTSCFPPAEAPFAFAGVIGDNAQGTVAPDADASGAGTWAGRGLFWGTLAAFLAGVALSLTPCVYPMIGITVAVIGGRGMRRGRTLWLTFLYVLGLSLVYALAGVGVALAGSGLAAFLRSAWVLAPIGVIFLLLGLSMFDLFALQTPGSWAARLQALGHGGGPVSVFIMGALSAFVVGPCVTGPLISLVAFVAATGRAAVGFLYFFALAWGMGLLLFLAGGASSLLPRAGAWMERVKHVLGVVLIWGAAYFTRPLIGERVFFAAGFVCLAAGVAFAGLLTVPRRGAGRLGPAVARLALGLLLLTSGSVWWLTAARVPGAAAGDVAPGRIDLAAELAFGKPVLLDFTAPWCAICKEIERDVLARPEIQARLQAFRFVKVDYDSNRDLARRFELLGPPAFVFLRTDGGLDGPIVITGEDLRRRLLE